jgi:hypothetical protein
MNFFKKLFSTTQQRRTPDQCFKCGKGLQVAPEVMIGFGADVFSTMSKTPYNCKSCGTAFCLDCMSIMKKGNRRCAHCNNDIGW